MNNEQEVDEYFGEQIGWKTILMGAVVGLVAWGLLIGLIVLIIWK